MWEKGKGKGCGVFRMLAWQFWEAGGHKQTVTEQMQSVKTPKISFLQQEKGSV